MRFLMAVLSLALIILLIATSVVLIQVRYAQRTINTQLSQERRQKKQLEQDWQTLSLQYSRYSSSGNVIQGVKQKLKMHSPTVTEILYLNNPTK